MEQTLYLIDTIVTSAFLRGTIIKHVVSTIDFYLWDGNTLIINMIVQGLSEQIRFSKLSEIFLCYERPCMWEGKNVVHRT